MTRPVVVINLCLILLCALFGELAAAEKMLLSGRVHNLNGHAVQGAELFVYRTPDIRRAADYVSVPTDEKGRFQLKLPVRRYWIVARFKTEKFGPLLPGDLHSGRPLEVDFSGPGEYEINFVIMSLQDALGATKSYEINVFRISGTVTDRNGIPEKDLYVFANKNASIKEIPDYVSGWTDDNGRYSLFLPKGKYFLGIAVRFPMGTHDKVVQPLQVKGEQDGVNITSQLSEETIIHDLGEQKDD